MSPGRAVRDGWRRGAEETGTPRPRRLEPFASARRCAAVRHSGVRSMPVVSLAPRPDFEAHLVEIEAQLRSMVLARAANIERMRRPGPSRPFRLALLGGLLIGGTCIAGRTQDGQAGERPSPVAEPAGRRGAASKIADHTHHAAGSTTVAGTTGSQSIQLASVQGREPAPQIGPRIADNIDTGSIAPARRLELRQPRSLAGRRPRRQGAATEAANQSGQAARNRANGVRGGAR